MDLFKETKLMLRLAGCDGVEDLDDAVVRFERRANGVPYAICYVDASGKLPESAEAFELLQERVVGKRYFEGNKSLQWNTYFYFVVHDGAEAVDRPYITQDRRYARKVVVTLPELSAALRRPFEYTNGASANKDILAVWMDALAKAGLDTLISGGLSLSKRVDQIEQGSIVTDAPHEATVEPRAASREPLLRRVEVRDFRRLPKNQEVEFGRVTLLSGPNGTGKTSLLEAIELAYCGKTKRNPAASEVYSLLLTKADGSSDVATRERSQSVFRDRNLAWYGVSEPKTSSSSLFRSFSRFNFLNTDAAVNLTSDAPEDELQEALARLLVGPDASKVWKEIERTEEAISTRVGSLIKEKALHKQGLEEAEAQEASSTPSRKESIAVRLRLEGLLRENTWTLPAGEASLSIAALNGALAELSALVKDGITCTWVGSPVTTDALARFSADGESMLRSVVSAIAEHDAVEEAALPLALDLERLAQKLAGFQTLREYEQSGYLGAASELESLNSQLSIVLSKLPTPAKESHILRLRALAEQSLQSLLASVESEIEATSQMLMGAKQRHNEFRSLRAKSESLAQELRNVALQILNSTPDSDICPLCHYRHPEGELRRSMHVGVDPLVEARSTELLGDLRILESKLQDLEETRQSLQWAKKASVQVGLPLTSSIKDLLEAVSDCHQLHGEMVDRRESLGKELERHRAKGLTADRLDRLVSDLSWDLHGSTPRSLEVEISTIQSEQRQLHQDYSKLKDRARVHLEEALRLLHVVDADMPAVRSRISEVTDQTSKAKSLLAKLSDFSGSIPIHDNRPLTEVLMTLETARTLAVEYLAAFERERIADMAVNDAKRRILEHQRRLEYIRPRLDSLDAAQSVLKGLKDDHSLSDAVRDVLNLNLAAVESIFNRIHSPADFLRLGESWAKLVRKDNGAEVSLSEVSTGQRAAYALSLFLAQNARATSAPPLMLIDDPVAHVDDLNSFAFLDYLREVIVHSDRQLVFATADEKLASIFERKFDFLGKDGFRRYDLSRGADGAVQIMNSMQRRQNVNAANDAEEVQEPARPQILTQEESESLQKHIEEEKTDLS